MSNRFPTSAVAVALGAVVVLAICISVLRSKRNDTGSDAPVAPAAAPAPSAPPRGEWPLVRGDALASGVARSELPENLELLWKFEVPNGGFGATPIVVGDRVYIGDLDGIFRALDIVSGKEQWKFKSEDSFNASPAYRDGLLYIGDSAGAFYCLDAATGKKKWTVKADAEIDSSANFFKDNVLFGSQDATLYCLNAKTGAEVWHFRISEQIRCTPTVVEDRAFVAGCDGKFHIVDLKDGSPVGEVDIESPTGATPAVCGDVVYFGTHGGTFFAIDWRKAEILWRWENAERPEMVASAAVLPDEVIFASHDKQLRALDTKNSGKVLWTFPTHSQTDSSPVIAGNRVFFGSSDGRIYGLDRLSGKKVWEYEAGGSFIAAPAVTANRLFIASDAGVVYCFGAKSP